MYRLKQIHNICPQFTKILIGIESSERGVIVVKDMLAQM